MVEGLKTIATLVNVLTIKPALSISIIPDNLESGKSNYCLEKVWPGKSLEFWIQKSVRALYEEDIKQISLGSTNQNNFSDDFCRHSIKI